MRMDMARVRELQYRRERTCIVFASHIKDRAKSIASETYQNGGLSSVRIVTGGGDAATAA